jgi:hypothetical protein
MNPHPITQPIPPWPSPPEGEGQGEGEYPMNPHPDNAA